MAISPVNVSRISNGLRTNFVLDSMRRTQLDLLQAQARISTGRSFVAASDDPVGASRVADLSALLARGEQYITNAQHADNMLSSVDAAINDVDALLTQVTGIASQNVSNLTSSDERDAMAELVAAIRGQLRMIGNRQLQDRYMFAGRETLDPPFVDVLGGIAYVGDSGDLIVQPGDELEVSTSIPGDVLFGALSSRVAGMANLAPLLVGTTRLDELQGATGQGIVRGTLVFNEQGGAGVFTVDLTAADTIDDVVTLINNAAIQAGANVTASFTDTGLVITPGSDPVTVTDTASGAVASTLGLLTSTASSSAIIGADLGSRITRLTPVEALAGGAGIDLASGLTITNGTTTVTVDLSQAQTVQDIVNTINNAGAYVYAQINEAGTGIDLVNQVSGTNLSVGENGGTTAMDLGLRTMTLETPLSELNFGAGVTSVEGLPDFQITARDGTTIPVDIDGAVTVGDVINLINDAAQTAGVNVTASLADVGNGIRLTDGTGGSGQLSVGALNSSTAPYELGIALTTTDTQTELIGEDRAAVRAEGVLGALIDLETALRRDDTRQIAAAAERIDRAVDDVTRIHGIVGSRSQAMRSQVVHTQDAAATGQILISQVQDLDYAEAVTRMQSAVTQLQANFQTSSTLLNMSLMDFLR